MKEVAQRLGLSAATVYKLCADGTLPHVRLANAVRVEEAALTGFIRTAHR